MTLAGIDVSEHQTLDTLKAWLPKSEFVLIKATEGGTYDDSKHEGHTLAARAAGKLVGHYHFARPDNNGPLMEAEHFVSVAQPKPGEVMVLDWEPYNHPYAGDHAEWIIAFANRVKSLTGAPCWLYVSRSMAADVIAKANAGQRGALYTLPLWMAAYASAPGDPSGWELTCWQHTDKPIDQNTFYGDAALWRRLAVPTPQENDMQLTDIVGKDPDSGEDVTLAQVVARALYAYNQTTAGGDLYIKVQRGNWAYLQTIASGYVPKAISNLSGAIAANLAGESERVKKLLEDASVDITVNLPAETKGL